MATTVVGFVKPVPTTGPPMTMLFVVARPVIALLPSVVFPAKEKGEPENVSATGTVDVIVALIEIVTDTFAETAVTTEFAGTPVPVTNMPTVMPAVLVMPVLVALPDVV